MCLYLLSIYATPDLTEGVWEAITRQRHQLPRPLLYKSSGRGKSDPLSSIVQTFITTSINYWETSCCFYPPAKYHIQRRMSAYRERQYASSVVQQPSTKRCPSVTHHSCSDPSLPVSLVCDRLFSTAGSVSRLDRGDPT